MEIQTSFASQLYDTAQKLGSTGAAGLEDSDAAAGPSFAESMAEAARELAASLEKGERAALDAMQGRGDVQSVVEALSATELALQTAVTVRDRVVQAYQDVLRMPI